MKKRVRLILVYERSFGYLMNDRSERIIGKTLSWERSNSRFWLSNSHRSIIGNEDRSHLMFYYDDRNFESLTINIKKSYT